VMTTKQNPHFDSVRGFLCLLGLIVNLIRWSQYTTTLSTAVGVVILSVAAVIVIWRIKPE
jgi:hypothetical protein